MHLNKFKKTEWTRREGGKGRRSYLVKDLNYSFEQQPFNTWPTGPSI